MSTHAIGTDALSTLIWVNLAVGQTAAKSPRLSAHVGFKLKNAGIEDAILDHSTFSRARNEHFREGDVFRRVLERIVETCIGSGRPRNAR
jgi:hypothetical protein